MNSTQSSMTLVKPNLYERRNKKSAGVTYYARFRDEHGKQKFVSLKTASVREAEKRFRELLADIDYKKGNIQRIEGGDKPLDLFKEEYLHFRKDRKSFKTVQADEYALRRFIEFVGNIHLTDVTVNLIDDFVTSLQSLDRSPSTIDQHIRAMKASFNWAIRRGYINSNPFVGIERPRIVETERAQALSLDEIDKLMEEVKGSHWEQMVKFILWTGCRKGEALSLKGNDVDYEKEIVLFRASKTKSKRNREIPFGKKENLRELMESLKCEPEQYVFRSNHPNGQEGWSLDSIARYLKKIFRKIGVPWATTHTLRHTFATHMITGGVPLWTVSRILGHSSTSITEQTYAHLIPEHTEEAMARLPF